MYRELTSLASDILYLVCLFILAVFILILLQKKFIEKWIPVFVIAFIIAPLLYAYWYYSTTYLMGTLTINLILETVVIVVGVRFMGFLKLKIVDYAMLFMILCVSQFGVYAVRRGGNLIFVLILVSIEVIAYLRNGKLTGNMVSVFLSFAAASLNCILFNALYQFFLQKIYYPISYNQGYGKLNKIIVMGIGGVIFLLMSGALIFIIKRIFHATFHNLDTLSERYREIEKYLMIMLMGLVLLLFLSEQIPQLFLYENAISAYRKIVNLLIITMIGMQVIYLNILLRTIRLKENLEIKEQTQQNLILYSSNLEQNMKNIRGLKHDMKNLLLTMGEYVEQSGNEKMKEFYHTQIVPVTDHEIRMNDIYTDLQAIQNEPFRAFLYYKLVQGTSTGVDMQLESEKMSEVSNLSIDFADIIRVLGIFLDNAIEEAVESGNGAVYIKIVETDTQASFIIKNTIRAGVKEKGISQGTTTKGLGRGNGLIIANEIINKYRNVALNSYFNEGLFVQNLTVFK